MNTSWLMEMILQTTMYLSTKRKIGQDDTQCSIAKFQKKLHTASFPESMMSLALSPASCIPSQCFNDMDRSQSTELRRLYPITGSRLKHQDPQDRISLRGYKDCLAQSRMKLAVRRALHSF